MGKIGDTEYRVGARERMLDAQLFLREGQLGGSIYLAGRAVEGMLRAIIWRGDQDYVTGRKILHAGHDLRRLFVLAASLGSFGQLPFRNQLAYDVQTVGRSWWNDLRFCPQKKIEAVWREMGIVHERRTFKQAAVEQYNYSARIIRRCEVVWQR